MTQLASRYDLHVDNRIRPVKYENDLIILGDKRGEFYGNDKMVPFVFETVDDIVRTIRDIKASSENANGFSS